MHAGDSFWLNCVLIGKEDLNAYVEEVVPEQRTTQFFYLALGLGKLLDIPAGGMVVRALWQLIEEYEYHFSNGAIQMVKYTTAKHSDTCYPLLNPSNQDGKGGEQEASKPGLFRFSNEVVYMHLQTPHVAFELDYTEVLFSLCDVLGLLYNKFLDEETWQNQVGGCGGWVRPV